MKFSCDVLVVGAGPAGLSAASSAAKKGVRTLLIDKRTEIGDNNHCGELLPSTVEIKDLLPRHPKLRSWLMYLLG